MTKGRVLLIAYYYPPSGGSGSRRMVALSRHLPQFGWDVEVLTPNPLPYYYPGFDDLANLSIKIHRTNSWEPNRFGSSIPQTQRLTLRHKLSVFWNLVPPPDDKLGWVPFARHKLKSLLQTNPFDIIISSGPPHSIHLIPYKIKANAKWIMDMRDEWTDFPLRKYPSKLHQKIDSNLEQNCITTADHIVEINEYASQRCQKHWGTQVTNKISTIPNGYEPSELDSAPEINLDSNYMNLVYTGTLHTQRNANLLIPVLRELVIDGNFKICLHIIGARPQDQDILISNNLPPANFRLLPPVERSVALGYLKAADVLWLEVGNWQGAENILPGKTFEYLASGKPILLVAPSGATYDTVKSFHNFYPALPDDAESLKAAIIEAYTQWMKKIPSLTCSCDKNLLESITWHARAIQYDHLLTTLLKNG